MRTCELELSGYKGMWLFVMFDVPAKTRAERKRYTTFRRSLLSVGFTQLQFSVYARYFPTEESSESTRRQIAKAIPPDGHVRILRITDRQFGKMESFVGKKQVSNEQVPEQLLLF